MKADAAQIEVICRAWPAELRLILLHGADVATSRDYADMLARSFASAENPMAVETLTGTQVANDPQALVAAVGAVSMFGERTLVRVDGLDDDGAAAVAAILKGEAGNPAVAIAAALKKGSTLLTLADRSPAILAVVNYEPTLRDAQRLANELGNPLGLRVDREAAVALFEAAGGDRTIMRREVEKLGLYLDSAADRPRQLTLAAVIALGVGVGDSDQFGLGGAVAGGRMALASDLLARLPPGLGIVALRAVERRLTLLLGLRGVVDGGASPQTAVDGARPPIFFKEKEAVAVELAIWSTEALARGLAALLTAERAIKSSGGIGDLAAEAALLSLTRHAAGRRRRV